MSASVRKTFSVEDLVPAGSGQDTSASLGLGGSSGDAGDDGALSGDDHDVPPLRTCGVTRNLYNLLVLSMAFFFIFFPFITAQAFAAPLLGYLGSISLIVLYVMHAASCCVYPFRAPHSSILRRKFFKDGVDMMMALYIV